MGQLDSGQVCTHLRGLWRTVVSLIRGVNNVASNNRLKELDLILLPGMDNIVSKCTEGYSEEKVKRSTEFNSDKSRNHRGQTLGKIPFSRKKQMKKCWMSMARNFYRETRACEKARRSAGSGSAQDELDDPSQSFLIFFLLCHTILPGS